MKNQKTVLVIQGAMGTDNIAKTFVVVLTLFAKIKQLITSFSFAKLVDIGLEVMKYGNIIAVARQAFEEFKEFNPQKAKQVKDQVKADFDIQDDQLEGDLEQAIDLLEESYSLGFDIITIGQRWIQFFSEVLMKKVTTDTA